MDGTIECLSKLSMSLNLWPILEAICACTIFAEMCESLGESVDYHEITYNFFIVNLSVFH